MPPDAATDVIDADLLLAGGGLASSLIAWRLAQLRPEVRVQVLEQGDTLGGNHTWSFHASDLDAQQQAWIAPLVVHRWPAHRVRFPGLDRTLDGDYCSITSARLHQVVHAALPGAVRLRTPVQALQPDAAVLGDGRRLRAHAVIDARGPVAARTGLSVGYQKFLGQEVRTRTPHGLHVPILMDATVPQHGGYRFIYVLPFADDVLLIEDTCYADDPHIDAAQLRQRIAQHAQAQGWPIAAVLREERGVLPILLGGDIERFWRANPGQPRAGLAAALFHPTTGYSLPEAVALAERLARQGDWSAAAVHAAIRQHALERWRHGAFFRMLNRMLFRAAAPAERRQVMARFYRLDAGLIARFYANRLHALDKLRIVTGRPPVPLGAAVRAALDRRDSAAPDTGRYA